MDYWENLALFASQKVLSPEMKRRIRSERLSQNSHGLAMSLRGMGTGKQPSYWNCLANFTFPVLLITGALDEKFEKSRRKCINFYQIVRMFQFKKRGMQFI